MDGGQIDKLCRDWLQENYDSELAAEYTSRSLVIPAWNSVGLNNALEDLKRILCLAFGPDESFGSIDYHRATEKLGLPDDSTPLPEVFIKAFARK